MRRRRFQSKRWIPVISALLGAFAAVVLFAAGRWSYTPHVQRVIAARPPIANGISYSKVLANFGSKPFYAGPLSELPGFACSGWHAISASGKHGWVVIRCSR